MEITYTDLLGEGTTKKIAIWIKRQWFTCVLQLGAVSLASQVFDSTATRIFLIGLVVILIAFTYRKFQSDLVGHSITECIQWTKYNDRSEKGMQLTQFLQTIRDNERKDKEAVADFIVHDMRSLQHASKQEYDVLLGAAIGNAYSLSKKLTQ